MDAVLHIRPEPSRFGALHITFEHVSYNPNSILPFDRLLFNDSREKLVDVCVQLMIVVLDYDYTLENGNQESIVDHTLHDNLFINYLARIHREEDFRVILKGFSVLLNNPTKQLTTLFNTNLTATAV